MTETESELEAELVAAGHLDEGLTAAEDEELRQLRDLEKVGLLSKVSWERFVLLRLRDRRRTIREHRDIGSPADGSRERFPGQPYRDAPP
jgi:hypothetical protein